MEAPPTDTVEHWAHRYVMGRDLAMKLEPPPPPRQWANRSEPLHIDAPGRPPELTVEARGRRTPGRDALRRPEQRAQLLHTFLHHELQAAELMCRAVLAYPETPLAFRRGLIGICIDELRHMRMYAEHLDVLGCRFGDYPVNDWFWTRLGPETTKTQFVAVMGLGFEGANLDHTRRFAQRFRDVGDVPGAELQERVGEEEIPHVAFGAHWFEVFTGKPLTFEHWMAALPPPLSPMLMRGWPLHREARLRAGYGPAFVDALHDWKPTP